MYISIVALLMFVLPIAFVIGDLVVSKNPGPLIGLIGKWFVFWAIGVRLFTAGLRQVIKPELTARDILGIKDKESWLLVRELGYCNIAVGLLGLLTIDQSAWLVPAALVGGLFFGFAGFSHIATRGKKLEENVALVSDLFIFVVMVIFLVWKKF